MNTLAETKVTNELISWMKDISTHGDYLDFKSDCATIAIVLVQLERDYDLCLSASEYMKNLGVIAYKCVTDFTSKLYEYDSLLSAMKMGKITIITDEYSDYRMIFSEFETWLNEPTMDYDFNNESLDSIPEEIIPTIEDLKSVSYKVLYLKAIDEIKSVSDTHLIAKAIYRIKRLFYKMSEHVRLGFNMYDDLQVISQKHYEICVKIGYVETLDYNDPITYRLMIHSEYREKRYMYLYGSNQ